MSGLVAAALSERALLALKEERTSEAAQEDVNRQKRTDSNRIQLAGKLNKVLGLDLEHAAIEVDTRGCDPQFTVDGIVFDLINGHLHAYTKCAECGTSLVGQYVGKLADVGKLIESATIASCRCRTPAAAVASAPVPEPTTAERLLAALEDFVAERAVVQQ